MTITFYPLENRYLYIKKFIFVYYCMSMLISFYFSSLEKADEAMVHNIKQ